MAKDETNTPAIRRLRRGELLEESSPKSRRFYILQAGTLSISFARDRLIEICFAAAPQCIGEESVFGSPSSGSRALALTDCQVLSIPVEFAKSQIQGSSPLAQSLLKGLFERVRLAWAELKTVQQSREKLPCPPENTAKVFAVIFHTARFKGEPASDAVTVGWQDLRDYAVEVFDETENRLEQAIHILVRLGYASIEPKDAGRPAVADPGQWASIRLRDMAQIESFFEFFQNYHFRPGFASFLKTSEKITEITRALLEVADRYKADRVGLVQMPYRATIDQMKERLGNAFEGDQLFRLEQKGLFVKRVSSQEGGTLSFLKPEFEQMLLNWEILRQVEAWNEHGLAMPEEPAPEVPEAWEPLIALGDMPVFREGPPKPGELVCDTCLSPYKPRQKRCSTCDADLSRRKKAA